MGDQTFIIHVMIIIMTYFDVYKFIIAQAGLRIGFMLNSWSRDRLSSEYVQKARLQRLPRVQGFVW